MRGKSVCAVRNSVLRSARSADDGHANCRADNEDLQTESRSFEYELRTHPESAFVVLYLVVEGYFNAADVQEASRVHQPRLIITQTS